MLNLNEYENSEIIETIVYYFRKTDIHKKIKGQLFSFNIDDSLKNNVHFPLKCICLIQNM